MNRKLLKGGTVVSGSGSVPADVLIEGEKIAAVGTGEEIGRLADGDTEVVDVSGCLLFPGFIDAFVTMFIGIYFMALAFASMASLYALSSRAPAISWDLDFGRFGFAGAAAGVVFCSLMFLLSFSFY